MKLLFPIKIYAWLAELGLVPTEILNRDGVRVGASSSLLIEVPYSAFLYIDNGYIIGRLLRKLIESHQLIPPHLDSDNSFIESDQSSLPSDLAQTDLRIGADYPTKPDTAELLKLRKIAFLKADSNWAIVNKTLVKYGYAEIRNYVGLIQLLTTLCEQFASPELKRQNLPPKHDAHLTLSRLKLHYNLSEACNLLDFVISALCQSFEIELSATLGLFVSGARLAKRILKTGLKSEGFEKVWKFLGYFLLEDTSRDQTGRLQELLLLESAGSEFLLDILSEALFSVDDHTVDLALRVVEEICALLYTPIKGRDLTLQPSFDNLPRKVQQKLLSSPNHKVMGLALDWISGLDSRSLILNEELQTILGNRESLYRSLTLMIKVGSTKLYWKQLLSDLNLDKYLSLASCEFHEQLDFQSPKTNIELTFTSRELLVIATIYLPPERQPRIQSLQGAFLKKTLSFKEQTHQLVLCFHLFDHLLSAQSPKYQITKIPLQWAIELLNYRELRNDTLSNLAQLLRMHSKTFPLLCEDLLVALEKLRKPRPWEVVDPKVLISHAEAESIPASELEIISLLSKNPWISENVFYLCLRTALAYYLYHNDLNADLIILRSLMFSPLLQMEAFRQQLHTWSKEAIDILLALLIRLDLPEHLSAIQNRPPHGSSALRIPQTKRKILLTLKQFDSYKAILELFISLDSRDILLSIQKSLSTVIHEQDLKVQGKIILNRHRNQGRGKQDQTDPEACIAVRKFLVASQKNLAEKLNRLVTSKMATDKRKNIEKKSAQMIEQSPLPEQTRMDLQISPTTYNHIPLSQSMDLQLSQISQKEISDRRTYNSEALLLDFTEQNPHRELEYYTDLDTFEHAELNYIDCVLQKNDPVISMLSEISSELISEISDTGPRGFIEMVNQVLVRLKIERVLPRPEINRLFERFASEYTLLELEEPSICLGFWKTWVIQLAFLAFSHFNRAASISCVEKFLHLIKANAGMLSLASESQESTDSQPDPRPFSGLHSRQSIKKQIIFEYKTNLLPFQESHSTFILCFEVLDWIISKKFHFHLFEPLSRTILTAAPHPKFQLEERSKPAEPIIPPSVTEAEELLRIVEAEELFTRNSSPDSKAQSRLTPKPKPQLLRKSVPRIEPEKQGSQIKPVSQIKELREKLAKRSQQLRADMKKSSQDGKKL